MPTTPSGPSSAPSRSRKLPPRPRTNAGVEDDPHTIVYTQAIAHPRLRWATRRLEVWKGEPRARFTLRLNRISSEDPESFYLAFPLPCQSVMPETSCGGVPFVPFSDQLPGTCRDYFRHRQLGPLCDAGGRLDLGEPRCAAGRLRRPANQGAAERPAAKHAPPHGHDLRQLLVRRFSRRQSRRDGVPVRFGVAEAIVGCQRRSRRGPYAAGRAAGAHQSRHEGRSDRHQAAL